jgi:hypothetical protein
MPFYQPGTYQQVPQTYAGQTATIIEVKPSTMFAMMPTLTANQMASLPSQSQQAIENTKTASTIVVQFQDGTKADTGAMPVMASNLSTYLELLPDQSPSAALSSHTAPAFASTVTTTKQYCPVQLTNVRYASFGAGLALAIAVPISAYTEKVQLEYTNQSEQEISAVRFTVRYFDATDSPTFSQPTMVQEKLKPHKARKALELAWLGQRNTHLIAAVDRIKFKDGTVWQSDDTHSCRIESSK